MTIKEMLDEKAMRLFGRTIDDAHDESRCLRCWRKVGPGYMTAIDAKEYRISGFCPECFEDVMPADDQ